MKWIVGVFVLAKLVYALINRTWIVKLLGRHKGGYEYAFPYTVVIVAGAALTYWLFKAVPQAERLLQSILILK